MSGAKEFVDIFMQVQRDNHWNQAASPAQLVEEWKDFVEGCEQGYAMGLAEYMNDRMTRDQIEILLDHQELRVMDEMAWFRDAIAEVDERLRNLLTPLPATVDAEPWWKAGVPQRAGRELAEDVRTNYHIEIELSD